MMGRAGGVVACLCFAFGSILAAQSVPPDGPPAPPLIRFSTGSVPSVVTVGDRFEAMVRVAAPSGSRIEFPRAPGSSAVIQAVAPVRVLPGADGQQTASYPMVAWQTGAPALPSVTVRITTPDGVQQLYPVRLRLPEVRSVLPAGDSLPEPRGPKPIWQPTRNWHPLLLVAAALALAAGYLAWRWHERRRARVRFTGPVRTPREEALASLGRAAALLPSDRRTLLTEVAAALRRFLGSTRSEWSPDLTTAELLLKLDSAGVAPRQVTRLRELLRAADLVKFARHDPAPDEAERMLAEAREWVAGFASPDPQLEAGAAREAA